MKPLFALPALLLSGCATTSLHVNTPEGLVVKFGFPKNMEARDLHVQVGSYQLSAKYIRTDASGVVKEQVAGVKAVAESAGKVADAANIIP